MRVGSLGGVVFETSQDRILTPGSVSFSSAARWEDHQVQGQPPAPEFLSPELHTCALQLRLRADLGVSPLEEADKLEEYLATGQVLQLVVAGRNLGRFSLRKITQTWRHTVPGAVGPMAIDLNLELKEYR